MMVGGEKEVNGAKHEVQFGGVGFYVWSGWWCEIMVVVSGWYLCKVCTCTVPTHDICRGYLRVLAEEGCGSSSSSVVWRMRIQMPIRKVGSHMPVCNYI